VNSTGITRHLCQWFGGSFYVQKGAQESKSVAQVLTKGSPLSRNRNTIRDFHTGFQPRRLPRASSCGFSSLISPWGEVEFKINNFSRFVPCDQKKHFFCRNQDDLYCLCEQEQR